MPSALIDVAQARAFVINPLGRTNVNPIPACANRRFTFGMPGAGPDALFHIHGRKFDDSFRTGSFGNTGCEIVSGHQIGTGVDQKNRIDSA